MNERCVRPCIALFLASTLLQLSALGQTPANSAGAGSSPSSEPDAQGIRDLGPYLRGQTLHFTEDAQALLEDSDWAHLAKLIKRTPDAAHSFPLDANSTGWLVGLRLAVTESAVELPRLISTLASSAPKPFMWDGQTLVDILPKEFSSGRAIGLNELGHVVGSYVRGDGEERPFLWWNQEFYDIQRYCWRDSDWRLQRAFDIADDGTIVGFGWHKDELRLFALDVGTLFSTGGGPEYPPGGGPFTNVGTMSPGTGLTPFNFVAPPLCITLGGEQESFGNWTCEFRPNGGTYAAIDCATSANAVIPAGSAEPKGIPIPTVLGRGGSYGLRIGDTIAGANGNAILAPFYPTNAEPDFIFDYALVLQDCDTNPVQQPSFIVQAIVNGATVYSQTVTKNCTDPYFNCSSAPTFYRNWSCWRIPLGNYIGQEVTIRLEATDCSNTGHFGYAYVDVPCNPKDLSLVAPDYVCQAAKLELDGTNNIWGEHHFWSIHELDLNGNPTHEEIMSWFPGPAGKFDITQFAAANGLTLTCGHKYNVKLAMNSECLGWVESTKVVRVECPVVDAGPDKDVCFDTSGTPPTSVLGNPQAFSGTAECPYTYEWKDDGGNIIGSTKIISVSPGSTTVYTLTVTDPCTGCTNSDTVKVDVLRDDMAVVITPTYMCLDFHIPPNMGTKLTASVPGYGGSLAEYSWTPGSRTGPTIYADPVSETTYTVTVTHPDGCVTMTASIVLPGEVPFALIAPNAFTPTGNINKEFIIWHLGMGPGLAPAYDAKEWELRLFSQAGPPFLVLKGKPPSGGIKNGDIKWDGKLNGSYVAEDVYVFKLWLLDCSDEWREVLTGHVSVIY